MMSGCTFLNAPDETLIQGEISCTNGTDDEGDGLIDCEDPECLPVFQCLATMPLMRDPKCDPVIPPYTLHDQFDDPAVDRALWFVGQSSEPRVTGGAVELVSSRITSTSTIQIGATIPFSLTVTASVVDYDRAPGGCTFDLAFDAAISSPRPVLEVHGRYDDRTLSLSCTYRGVPLPSDVDLVYPAGRDFELAIARDADSRQAVARIDEQEICRTEMVDVEPEVRVRVASKSMSLTDCGLSVSALELSLRAQEPPPSCAGLRRPLIPDDLCIPGPLATIRPQEGRVVRAGRDHYEMTMVTGRAELIRASSPDGRLGWRIDRDPLYFSPFASISNGGLLFDAGRLLLWVDELDKDGVRGRLLTGEPAGAWTPSPTPLALSGRIVNQSSMPHAVARAVDRPGYIGWFQAFDENNVGMILAGYSRFGLRWEMRPEPVLTRGAARSWDGRGVRSPAVFFNGDFYLMAYTATEFLGSPAIGIAVSRDGVTWMRHPDNPVVRGGEDEGFDDEGVEARSIALEGDRIRLWYLARTNAPSPCLRPTSDYKQIGLTELTGRGPVR